MAVEVIRVTPAVAEHLQGRRFSFPFTCYVGIEEGVFIGAGGLAWYHDRCWVWLGLMDMQRTRPNTLVRWARRIMRMAAQFDEVVCCERDPHEPMSARLLTLLGFCYDPSEPIVHTDGSIGEMWRYVQAER